jgi:hypothetical protein
MSVKSSQPYALTGRPKEEAKRKRMLSLSDKDIQATINAKEIPYQRG